MCEMEVEPECARYRERVKESEQNMKQKAETHRQITYQRGCEKNLERNGPFLALHVMHHVHLLHNLFCDTYSTAPDESKTVIHILLTVIRGYRMKR